MFWREAKYFGPGTQGNAGHPSFRLPPGHAGGDGLFLQLGGILLSVSEDRTVQPSATSLPPSGIADPAPLGLAAFALTTFLLSAIHSGWAKSSHGFDCGGYASAYRGLG